MIEQLGRALHAKRGDVAAALGETGVQAIYDHADVLHCEPIAKVAEDAAIGFDMDEGVFDNVKRARYIVPDVWTAGKIYARLIEDVAGDGDVVKAFCIGSPLHQHKKMYIIMCTDDGACEGAPPVF